MGKVTAWMLRLLSRILWKFQLGPAVCSNRLVIPTAPLFSAPSFSQRRFDNDRPFLGHQSGPAGLLHPLLAPEPRWRRFSAERGEPRHGGHDAHRLSAQVTRVCERSAAFAQGQAFLTASHFAESLLGLLDRSTLAAALRSSAAVAIVTRSPQSS